MKKILIALAFLFSANGFAGSLDNGPTAWIFDAAGNPINLGQTTMSSSLPVALASNQTGINSFLDKNQTGTLAATNATVAINTNGMNTVILTLTGTWSATVNLQGFDGTNWIGATGLTLPAGGITSALSANGSIAVPVGGFSQFRVQSTVYTSGTVNVFMNTGAGLNVVQVYNDSGSPIVIKGNGTAGTPDSNVVTVQGIASGTVIPSNVSQFDGTNISTGTGASGAGIPRVTVSNDSTVGLNAGSNIVGKVGIDQTTPGTTNLVASTPVDGYKSTYTACSGSFSIAATPTDVFSIQGSGTKTIRILHIEVNGTTTSGSGSLAVVQVIKRSAANTGGTSTAITALPHDSSNAATTATSIFYTVNPTALGAAVGTLRSFRDNFAAVGTVGEPLSWDFGVTPGQAPVLRGTTQYYVVNFNATTVTGGIMDICVDYSEE